MAGKPMRSGSEATRRLEELRAAYDRLRTERIRAGGEADASSRARRLPGRRRGRNSGPMTRTPSRGWSRKRKPAMRAHPGTRGDPRQHRNRARIPGPGERMNDPALGDSLETSLAGVTAALGRAEMRRDELLRRARDLTAAIELAKGRLALKEEVEAFIEAVHQETSRRNVGRLGPPLGSSSGKCFRARSRRARAFDGARTRCPRYLREAPRRRPRRRARGQWRGVDRTSSAWRSGSSPS